MNEEINKILQKHIEKYKGMTEEQIKEHLKQQEMKKYGGLNFAFVRVGMLLDYLKVLNNNLSQLEAPGHKVIIASGKKFDPMILKEYIILEVTSFYCIVRDIKGKEGLDELPDVPDYWDIIIDFRNKITAHLDKDGRFRIVAQWMEQYEKVDKIGITKIVKQFEEDYWKCYNILKEQM